ncbi:MAG: isoleucine--tRNA ligase [Thermoguttaceae bacterium]|nr:isoleucine--tRNA ligase [Thermoguttaceae bacterium]MDW8038073.1 isoleucine--tRNA ligase [Thermoguttaceae bacterium]
MFRPVESNVFFPALEEEVLRFWKERQIYEKSLENRRTAPLFVFYEGPPTANGLPHPGHCLTRAIKDLFPRYRTMRGYLCKRKAGWDTHGLPVEVEVCKELGIHSKQEIEQYGVEAFNRRCLESVFRYTKEWEELTERLGFWIHLKDAYVTYHQSYVESIWWALKELFDRGLLYQGHKIVWWWAQGGTALSAAEVGQGYRQVADPSVYVRFPLLEPVPVPTHVDPSGQVWADLLVWTTTPWTLPSNQFAAVKPDLEYCLVDIGGQGQPVVIASALVEQVASKVGKTYRVLATYRGSELVGRRYRPPFDYFYRTQGEQQGRLRSGGKEYIAWRVVPAEFVTVDTGTGIVHQAPAFGEVDYELLLEEQARFVESEGPPLLCPVAPDGTFTQECPDLAGRWVKDADPEIIRHLKAQGLLFHQEQYLHEYPFCWRAEEDPLIQYPRRSWFIRTRQFREEMLANNRLINWLPEHIRDGRFGNFLETNVDWALSRERYWGTPLPIWVCEKTGYAEAVASYQELLSKPGVSGMEVWLEAKRRDPELSEHLKVHKPYIDAITYDSPAAPGARMRRVPDVIDCWFDSGAMPFAQWGYPHVPGSEEAFWEQFPADFISEAIDQTRGWFYSLLAISTLLFGNRPSESTGQGAAHLGRPVPQCPASSEPTDSGKLPASVGNPLVGTQRQVPTLVSSSKARPVPYPHPFRNCIVLGLMLAEWWESPDGKRRFLSETEAQQVCGQGYVHKVGKMSKQLKNYRTPEEIFNQYGADALRWYFFANQAPWTSIVYSERAIKESIPEFLLRLWNVYSFFVIYANIDGFQPAKEIGKPGGQLTPQVLAQATSYRPVEQRAELDRWILSELHRTSQAVIAAMDAYDNFTACQRLSEFLDGLSNWYVRLSRDRFWSGELTADKWDAHWTLYECLVSFCKLIAPFVPFTAEAIWQNLAVAAFDGQVTESVHLCDYPTPLEEVIDPTLSARMALAREIVSLGRSARMSAKLKVRQPLSRVEVVLANKQDLDWLQEHAELIAKELNVHQVDFITHAEQYIRYTVLPDLKRLGPRLGRRLPAVREKLAQADPGQLLHQLQSAGSLTLELPDGPVELSQDEVLVRLEAKPGWTAAQGSQCVVVLSTELTPELVAEGLARELVHAIQNRRKELQCQYTDRIHVGVVTQSAELRSAIQAHRQYIMHETLALQLTESPLPGAEPSEVKLSGHPAVLYLSVAGKT